MLSLSLFTLFLVTSFANIMTPGIGFIMVIGLSLQRGWRGTIWAVVGLAVGIVILQAAGLSGMGFLVANNPTLYAAVKVVGALVLFYLSWYSWKKAGHGAIAVKEHTEHTHDTFFSQIGSHFDYQSATARVHDFGLSAIYCFRQTVCAASCHYDCRVCRDGCRLRDALCNPGRSCASFF